MTNREWIESLTNNDLALLLVGDECVLCGHEATCDGHCKENLMEWLDAEHKIPARTFTESDLIDLFRDKFLERRVIGLLEIEDVIKELYR